MPRERSIVRAQLVAAPALISAGINLSKRLKDGKKIKVRSQGWQSEAWRFFDVIGEYRQACTWAGNLLSKATLYPTKSGEKTTDEAAVEAMASFFGGTSGQSIMLEKLATHLSVSGEAYIIGFDEADATSRWEVLSSSAIQRSGDGFRIDGDDVDDVLVIRIWRPHPRDVKEADSPSRAVLPVLAELESLTKRVAAMSDSRLVGNGLLLLPSEISFPAAPVTENAGDPDNMQVSIQSQANQIAQLFMEVASKAIQDPESAAAMLPLIMQAPGEYIDKASHLTFWSELDAQAPELRTEAIRRIALGMDMPPEALTGTGEMNHWNAWALEEAAIKSYTEPFLAMITASLTEGYLRPALEAGGMDPEEAAEYSIGADTSALRLRPNRSREAQELYDRGALSAEALLRENGFDPSDAMRDVERREWFIRKVASGSTTPELVEAALRSLGADLDPGPIEAAPTEARPSPSLRDHPVRNPPPIPEGGAETGAEAATIAAAEVMVFRALERAGNRLKNRLGQNRPEAPAADMYLFVPRRTAEEIDDLLTDAWSCVDRFDCGMPPTVFAAQLDLYTRMLLQERRPHQRHLLAEFLVVNRLAVAS
jgi:hypothetical protein